MTDFTRTSQADRFAPALLEIALDHHERHWMNGDHDSMNCHLCCVLVQLSAEMKISIGDLKLELANAGARAS